MKHAFRLVSCLTIFLLLIAEIYTEKHYIHYDYKLQEIQYDGLLVRANIIGTEESKDNIKVIRSDPYNILIYTSIPGNGAFDAMSRCAAKIDEIALYGMSGALKYKIMPHVSDSMSFNSKGDGEFAFRIDNVSIIWGNYILDFDIIFNDNCHLLPRKRRATLPMIATLKEYREGLIVSFFKQ